MPYPAQITPTTLLIAARQQVETHGVQQLSLAGLAASLGVKAPSLYRLMPSKAALLKALNSDTLARLFAALIAATSDLPAADPASTLHAMALAYRQFALQNPHTYQLAFTTPDPAERPDPAELAQGALPFQALVAQIAGPEQALTHLRGLLAILHGFALLEINQQLQRGGDLAEAYRIAVETYLNGIPRA